MLVVVVTYVSFAFAAEWLTSKEVRGKWVGRVKRGLVRSVKTG